MTVSYHCSRLNKYNHQLPI